MIERLGWRMGKEMKQELLGTLTQDRGSESIPGGHMGPASQDSGSLEEGDRKGYHHPLPCHLFAGLDLRLVLGRKFSSMRTGEGIGRGGRRRWR